jgi:hypothetical protein
MLGQSFLRQVHAVNAPVASSLLKRQAAVYFAALLEPIEMPPLPLFYVIITAHRLLCAGTLLNP